MGVTEYIVRIAIYSVFVACTLAVLGSFLGDIIKVEYAQMMVYAVILLITVNYCLSQIASLIMFSVIIYALRVDYEFKSEHKELSSKLNKLLDDINRQSKKTTSVVWRLSDDHFWISVSRGHFEG